ncbi:MAG: Nif3-like dinuclear metal center hexameric protein [Planctomycetes bacterium]|nr:Nif3-like dinuclear metal center hexameric protein [Planctomycetota bacterium]
MEEYRVDNAKDRGVRSDSQSERQYGDDSEGGVTPHSAQCVAEISPERVENSDTAGLPHLFLDPLDAAEVEMGTGRMGSAGGQLSLMEVVGRVKSFLGIDTVQVVGSDDQPVQIVAIACGSGGSLLSTAVERGCDCLVTGEIGFHGCLEAEARGVGLVLPGHFASERFALLSLADYLREQFSGIEVWASHNESDPLRSV